tara:strand:+ start:2296 stop:2925 length:630 start_codon:yes stop_codon:yes gene_type:complete
MARFTPDQMGALADKIKANDTTINRAASLAINKTVTFAKDLSVSEILRTVNLQQSYVRRNLKTAKRASPNDLSAIIRANTRETLLTRYPYQETSTGVRVAVNKTTGYRTIKRAFRVTNLRGSGASGIALKNRDAVEVFRRSLSPSTPGKSRKLQRIISKARTKPNGITVLHSRSINQLFTSVREDVQPRTFRFMADEFISDLRRLQGTL